MQDLIKKADVLLEALPYVQRFRSSTFVVKYGGSFMDSPDPKVREGVAADIVFLEAMGINPVVVHGGGKSITKAMEKAGIKAQFIQGMRVTDEKSMDIVEDVLGNVINRDIVETIQKLGGKARSFSGKDVFKCHKLLTGGVDLGYVGGVTDKGMIPKVDSAVEAVQAGVRRVHFVDGRVPHSILLEIFTDKGIGTEIVK